MLVGTFSASAVQTALNRQSERCTFPRGGGNCCPMPRRVGTSRVSPGRRVLPAARDGEVSAAAGTRLPATGPATHGPPSTAGSWPLPAFESLVIWLNYKCLQCFCL